ncbi:MAG: class I SAM-dependent methyltransferase [Bryobacterales bacterium]|nr:class I SAM-dependent methyltransferase [Bryobacterales bacterium]
MRSPFNLRRMVPPALQPAARSIYYRFFRLHLRVRLWCADGLRTPLPEGPVPPAMLRFRVSETISAGEFLRVGKRCADLVRQLIDDMGGDFGRGHRVLDFGCGCGRTIRWFLQEAGNAEFHGVDVDADAVDWCSRHLGGGHFLTTSAVPPLPYPTGHFDIVYCLSVFTHLNEPMQDVWLAELSRILKPRGLLLLTIYGQPAWRELDEEGRQTLQETGFVHRRSEKLRGLVPEWYHTTWHLPQYMIQRLSGSFVDVHYCRVPEGQQDMVVARRAGG